MNMPIETVVELLMANSHYDSLCYGNPYWVWVNPSRTEMIEAKNFEDIRSKVREYLLTLVPKPKLLSECEEYKNVTTQGETIVYRVGNWKHYSENVPCSPE